MDAVIPSLSRDLGLVLPAAHRAWAEMFRLRRCAPSLNMTEAERNHSGPSREYPAWFILYSCCFLFSCYTDFHTVQLPYKPTFNSL